MSSLSSITTDWLSSVALKVVSKISTSSAKIIVSTTPSTFHRDASAYFSSDNPSLTSPSAIDALGGGDAGGDNSSSSTEETSIIKSLKNKKKGKDDDNKDDSMGKIIAGLLVEIVFLGISSWISIILVRKFLGGAIGGDDEHASSTAAEKRLIKLLKEQGKNNTKPALTSYEKQIAQDVIDPADISIEFADIGGMDSMKQEIWELTVLPLRRPDLFASSNLLQAPGGILLYGPPGTGKTMLAKAIAHEAEATFLAVKLSKIMSKWFGESNKLIDAIFTLARKLAPSIIFIDEIDTFLNPRDGSENSAGNAIKAEFLTLWDGITTQKKDANDTDEEVGQKQHFAPVMVLGATNRPDQVDNAILRRLPRMFRIELPTEEGRLQIIELILENSKHPVDEDVQAYLPQLAKSTIGYSGSDLKELLNCAALEAVREVMQQESQKAVMMKKQSNKGEKSSKKNKKNKKAAKKSSQNANQDEKGADNAEASTDKKFHIRPMSTKDLRVAMTKVKRTGQDAAEYQRTRFEHEHPNRRQIGNYDKHINTDKLLQLVMSSLSSPSPQASHSAKKDDDDKMGRDDKDDDDADDGDIPIM